MLSTFFDQAVHFLTKSSNHFCYFNSENPNFSNYPFLKYEKILAWGAKKTCVSTQNYWNELNNFIQNNQGFKFGYLSYDLKNEIEKLTSRNNDDVGFEELAFFIPEFVLIQQKNKLVCYGNDLSELNKAIEKIKNTETNYNTYLPSIQFKPKTNKEDYLKNVLDLKQQIQLGNIYEINYCIEFFANQANVPPMHLYNAFVKSANVPFSAFCRFNDHYFFSASPERFITRQGNRVISQPIKGTSKRNFEITINEEHLQLKNSLKDSTENVMIVDLVRNDLSKTAVKGSVKVHELFGVYSFPSVNQMISTVISKVNPIVNSVEIIKSCFPMGSMTGAPKLSAMQIAEKTENFKRGMYSGAIGYFDENQNFDFNVVIRTAIYNAKTNYMSYAVGGAITALSNPYQEYEECLLKAERFFNLFKKEN